jgi:ubiquinone biosynthesis protein COQ9
MIAPADMTLDELRLSLAERLPTHAVFDGWSATALANAADELDVPADRAALCFPGGAIEMIDAWFATIDAAMAEQLQSLDLGTMKIRDRIRTALLVRLDEATRQPDALRRAITQLGRPLNAGRAVKLAWRAADSMWRAIGDTSVDFAWYSKRATLAALYTSVLTAWMDDDSEDFSDTRAFLDRRIDDVMRFEKFKVRLKPEPDRHFSPVRFLGRLRYRLQAG